MIAAALAPYEAALATAGPLHLHTDDGRSMAFDVARWLGEADEADQTVLSRCRGPVLDVGCGPGRFVAALSQRRTVALGVDIAAAAVAGMRRRGLPVLHRDVFADLPGAGRWPTVLLMDGNIGIGGDPGRLLARIRTLLAADGQLLVEVDADAGADRLLTGRFGSGGRPHGPAFGWACVGLAALVRYGHATGYAVTAAWSAGGRSFAALTVAPQ